MPVGYAHGESSRRPHQLVVTGLALVGVLLTGCAHPEHAGLANLLTRIERADSNEDLEGVLACYSDDAIWFPPDGSVICGINAIRSRYQQLFAENDQNVTIHTENINSGDGVASVSGLTQVRRTPRIGGTCVTSPDRFILLVRHSGTGWRVHMLAWWPESISGK